jgi:hypothetical protein
MFHISGNEIVDRGLFNTVPVPCNWHCLQTLAFSEIGPTFISHAMEQLCYSLTIFDGHICRFLSARLIKKLHVSRSYLSNRPKSINDTIGSRQ